MPPKSSSSKPAESPKDESASALVDDVAARIRSMVLSGEIPIGAQLRQAELAKTFGVSRTPIREALRQLKSGGLIEVLPNRGAVVRVPVPWEVREAYEVRAELEGLAAARAATRISRDSLARMREANQEMYDRSVARSSGDEAAPRSVDPGNDVFHTLILEASGNERLVRSVNEINDNFPRNVSALLLLEDARHRDDNFHEHERILEALENGDAEKARAEVKKHVLAAGEQLAHWYERRSSTVFHG